MAVARLSPLAVLLQVEQTDRPLVGAVNGTNLIFSTPDKFLPGTLRLYRNGARLKEGLTYDYTVSESVIGAGLDTVVFTEFAPRAGDNLISDYFKQGA